MKTTVIYEPKGRAREYAALAANLYKGCPHGCLYCWAPSATFTDAATFHGSVKPREGIIQKFRRDCAQLRGTGQSVLLCFTCDPYSPIETEHGLTRQAIESLHEFGLTAQILTKGGSRAVKDFDLLTAKDAFASTLTFLDPDKSRYWEPNAALPENRIDTIRFAHDKGIQTWVSLEPVIEPAQTLEIIQRTHKFVDLFKVGTLNYRDEAKAIDWATFGRQAVALLEKLGKQYYVKQDLHRYLKAA